MATTSSQQNPDEPKKTSAGALTPSETTRLNELENDVERGQRGSLDTARALKTIKEEKLFRATHSRAEDYARERFDIETSQFYYLLNAAAVDEPLSTMMDAAKLPKNARQARELYPLLLATNERVLCAFWTKLLRDHGGRVTSKEIAKAVRKRLAKARPDPIRPPKDPNSKTGDIYELGPHRLLCGDAADFELLSKFLGEIRPEVLWTDPPYGVNLHVRDPRRAIANDDPKVVFNLLVNAFANANKLLAPGARFYIAAPSGEMQTEFRLALRKVGWLLQQELVWLKDTFVLGRTDYQPKHESVLYGSIPGLIGGRRITKGPESRWYGGDNAPDVFEVARPRTSKEHPTMKPPELIEQMLRNSVKQGDIVLDLFAGSGSTLEACHSVGAIAYLVELEPRYCDVIRDRWEKLERLAGKQSAPARARKGRARADGNQRRAARNRKK